MKNKCLLPQLQSAYQPGHSTETAVLKVLSDVLLAVDDGNMAVLALLDLSAAFDSVDHDTLLRRLQTSYGLEGAVIGWFTPYSVVKVRGQGEFSPCFDLSPPAIV